MEVNLVTINSLFANAAEQFLIPSYQRRYSWGSLQVKELIDDVMSSNIQEGHLLGMIILHRYLDNNGFKIDVVDGQQRLTTISLILKAMANTYRNRNIQNNDAIALQIEELLRCQNLQAQRFPKIVLGNLDNDDYNNIINGINHQLDNRKLYEVTEWLNRKFNRYSYQELNDFHNKFLNSAQIIKLVANNIVDANKLFETFNNRGLPLTKTDIIKNLIFGEAARLNNLDVYETVKTIWTDIIYALDNLGKEDDFFRRFISSVTLAKVSESKLIEKFKQHLGGLLKIHDANLVAKGQALILFLKEILLTSLEYRKIVKAEYLNIDINKEIITLNTIKGDNTYVFLMQFMQKNVSNVTKIDVIKKVTTLMLRRHICKKQTGANEQIFVDLTKTLSDIENNDQFTTDLDAKLKNINNYPDDNEFKNFLKKFIIENKISEKRAKVFLERFSTSLNQNIPEDTTASELFHIIPEDFNIDGNGLQWQAYLNGQTVAPFINRLGNLTLKHPNDITYGVGNHGNIYQHLIASFDNSPLGINRSLKHNFPNNFEPAEINNRESLIIEEVVSYWSL